VVSSLGPVIFVAGTLGYAVVLGAAGVRLVVLAAGLLVAFGPILVAAVLAGIAAATGSDPAVTPEGLRIRVRPWRRRTVLVPWADLTAVWIGYTGRRAFLCVRAGSIVPPANGAPVAVYIPAAVGPDAVRSAIERAGTVRLWNHDPDAPDGRRRVRFAERPRSLARVIVVPLVALLIWLLIIPWGLKVPQMWDQPWWPVR
jgi:hypothetical protein